MAVKNKIVETICPSCDFACHTDVSAIGKKTTCEKCGHVFETVKFSYPSLLNNFLNIAQKNDLISEKEYIEMAELHKASKTTGQMKRMEDLFIERGRITTDQKNRLMLASVRKLNRRFVNLAVEKGFISRRDGEEALSKQSEDFSKDMLTLVGDILIRNGKIKNDDRETLLAEIQKSKSRNEAEGLPSFSSENKDHLFIGHVALEKELINKEEFNTAVNIYQENRSKGIEQPFEDVLHDAGIISREIKNRLVLKTLKRMDQVLGRLAVENGFISRGELEKAAMEQTALFKSYEYRPILDILAEREEITSSECDMVFSSFKEMDEKDVDELVKKGKAILAFLASARGWQKDRMPSKTQGEDENKEDTKPVSSEPEIALSIADDGLSAAVNLSPDLKSDVGDAAKEWVKDIKAQMDEIGIVLGVVKDELIEACLKSAVLKKRSFKVAIGTPPEFGRDGKIIYHFPTDYLKAGEVTEDGVIDFRDRGDVPHVQKGDLLAELVPAIPGKNGYDIFGNVIPVPEIKEVSLKSGTGTVLSDDKLKIFAEIDGRPDLLINGDIAIYPEMTIKGDVNYETGNVNFKGNIVIQGTICEGFKVKGVNLTVQNINGGIVEVTGNVDVAGGVVESEIRSDGYVQAMYISSATVDAHGDLLVVKEIIDSTVRLAGACKSERCKIISSSLSAKMGIEVGNIGTDVSKPCKIRAGVNEHLVALVRLKEEKIDEEKEALEQKQANVEKYHDKLATEHLKIAELTKKQEELLSEHQRRQLQLEDHQKKGEDRDADGLLKKIKSLETSAEKTREAIKQHFEQQERFLEIILADWEAIEKTITRIERINEDIQMLWEKDKEQEGKAVVKVNKQIFSKSMVYGKKSSIILQEDLKNVTIRERYVTDPERKVPPRWEMDVSKNK